MIMLHDKDRLEAFLRRDTYLHIYSLGDLDDFFWRHTTWFGLEKAGELLAVALLYSGLELPCLLALSRPVQPMVELIRACRKLLPLRFYTHLSPGVEEVLRPEYRLDSHGKHIKMGLRDRAPLDAADVSAVERLDREDLKRLLTLYEAAYPGHWFEGHMLETGQYFGIREGGRLAAVSGVHVYSPGQRVAALGNIATHPDRRRRGMGRAVTARLCRSLLETADHIGLNVHEANGAARSLYRSLGFVDVAEYVEYMVEKR
ncbi:MAG: GNAT family N-acetyltransferase [Candidatus Eisenbacteria bacterium]|nr:GNAT family N-acetyltransferase [Candidatus Eisenbacteria bacterium]